MSSPTPHRSPAHRAATSPDPHARVFRFPDADACERANADAVLHPGAHGDLPCVEIDGVLVFAHLDPGLGALRITVHLDTAPGHLMRIDGTVPVHIEIDDTVVHEAHGAARTPLIDALLDAADDSHREAIRAAALAVGALWRCPACQWDNPDTAGCCQSPGPCGTPSPRTP